MNKVFVGTWFATQQLAVLLQATYSRKRIFPESFLKNQFAIVVAPVLDFSVDDKRHALLDIFCPVIEKTCQKKTICELDLQGVPFGPVFMPQFVP